MIGLDKSMSVDGFITERNPGPDQPLGEGGDRIFAWMMADRPERLSTEYTETLGDALTATGAVIMGKRSFEIIDSPEGWVAPIELECTSVVDAPGVTHLRFRVVNKT